jgi:outer membrane usher protein FimD/PapC
MGVFTRPDLNFLQERILATVIIRKRRKENELEEARFERDLFINNTAMYQEYMKNKQDNSENEGIVWSTPETMEEARAIDKLFAEAAEKTKKQQDEEETAANEEFVRQMSLITDLNNIDIDKLGDE